MTRSVVIDYLADSIRLYRRGYAVVSIDILRATTTAATAVALGRRCYPVPSIEAALPLAARLSEPLLVGELGGNMPFGFDLTNSPFEVAARGRRGLRDVPSQCGGHGPLRGRTSRPGGGHRGRNPG